MFAAAVAADVAVVAAVTAVDVAAVAAAGAGIGKARSPPLMRCIGSLLLSPKTPVSAVAAIAAAAATAAAATAAAAPRTQAISTAAAETAAAASAAQAGGGVCAAAAGYSWRMRVHAMWLARACKLSNSSSSSSSSRRLQEQLQQQLVLHFPSHVLPDDPGLSLCCLHLQRLAG